MIRLTRPLLLITVALIGCGGRGSLSRDAGADAPKDGDVTTDAIAGTGGGAGVEGLAGSSGAAGSAGTSGAAGTGEAGAGPAGRSGDGGIEAGGPPLTLPEYLSEIRRASCVFYAHCGFYPDVAACLAVAAPNVEGMTLLADVAAGRVIYDGARARVCLDSFDPGSTCLYSDLIAQGVPIDPCAGVFRGTLPAGSACYVVDECAAGTDCLATEACTQTCCMGTCVAQALRGASCAAALCPTGSYCRPQTLRCTTKGTVVGTVCDAEDGCAAPLFCVFDDQGNGTCERTLPATGAPCLPTVGCDDYRDVCAPNNVCTRRLGLGRTCPNVGPDADAGCVYYGYCQGGVCLARGLAGEACRSDPNTGFTDCVDGISCPATTKMCTPDPGPPISCR